METSSASPSLLQGLTICGRQFLYIWRETFSFANKLLEMVSVPSFRPCQACSGRLPDLIEDSCRDLGLVLGEKAPVVLRNHFGGVLNRIAGLFV